MNREDKIDNYILGRMSDEEKAAMERQMQEDAELRDEMLLMRNAAKAVRSVALKEMFVKEEKRIQDRRIMMIVVGIVVAVALVSIYVWSGRDEIETAVEAVPEVEAVVEETATVAQKEIETAAEETPAIEDVKHPADEMVDEPKAVVSKQDIQNVEVSVEKVGRDVTQDEYDEQRDEMELWTQAAEAINGQDWTMAKTLLRKVIGMNGQHKEQAQELLEEIEANIP